MTVVRFPGDPRYQGHHKLGEDDIEALYLNEFLSTSLLDFLIHRCFRLSSHTTSDGYTICCANTCIEEYMKRKNKEAERYRSNKSTVDRLWKKMKGFQDGKFKILLPHIQMSHFFTMVLLLDTNEASVVVSNLVFDSLHHAPRKASYFSEVTAVGSMLKTFATFFNNYVFYGACNKHKRIDYEPLLRTVEVQATPRQQNGIDCGLFTVGVVLYLLEGVRIQHDSFNQRKITELRRFLYRELKREFGFAIDYKPSMVFDISSGEEEHTVTSTSIWKHYGTLCNQDDESDVEIIHVVKSHIVKVENGFEKGYGTESSLEVWDGEEDGIEQQEYNARIARRRLNQKKKKKSPPKKKKRKDRLSDSEFLPSASTENDKTTGVANNRDGGTAEIPASSEAKKRTKYMKIGTGDELQNNYV